MKLFVVLFLLFNLFFYKANYSFAEEEDNIEEKVNEIVENNENDITKVVEKVLEATVIVEAIKLEDSNIYNGKNSHSIIEKSGNTNEIGTGFLISEDGFLLTNHHVIYDSDKIIVKVNNKEYQADIVGDDSYSDIALLKIKDGARNFPFLELKSEVYPEIGEKIIVVGNPYNLGLSVSTGVISAVDRNIKNTSYTGMIQTDANINKGNSGGPIFNKNGDVIGINSIIFSPNNNQNTGIGFAIPIKNVIDIVDKLKEFGYIQRGWLGITGEDATGEIFRILNSKRETGILVKEVIDDSPAYKAGILPADIIVSYNDRRVRDVNGLLYMIRNSSVNSNVNILILRAGKYIKLKATIKELPNENTASRNNKRILDNTVEFAGMYLTKIDKNLINEYKLYSGLENIGMYVLGIKDDKKVIGESIEVGDVIMSINQVQLKDKVVLNGLIDELKKRSQKKILLAVKKSKNDKVVILKMDIGDFWIFIWNWNYKNK